MFTRVSTRGSLGVLLLSSSSRHSMLGQIDVVAPVTLDESVLVTIGRDLKAIGSKLKVVLLPVSSGGDASAVLAELKDWDLWGPLLVCLMLSILLSFNKKGDEGPLVFSSVFFVVWAGACVVTLNAQLLGGTISFFQSVCVLGYCVFPLTVMAFVILLLQLITGTNIIVNSILVAIGFVWSTR